MASSATELLAQFRARFPEFDDVADSIVLATIDEALHIFALCDLPVIWLTAHLLAIDNDSGAGSGGAPVDGGEGETISESVGGVSASFKSMADKGSDSFYTTTAYGRRFLALRKTTPAYAFSVRVG
jgi:hypothetical protein